VTVANQELMQRLPGVVPDARLVFLPNGMWIERYDRRIEPRWERSTACSGRIVFTNADFLKVQESKEAILSALNVFFIRHPDYVLDFYGDPFPEMFSLPFLHFTNRISYQEYMRAIVAGDYMFAITPLGASEDADSAGFNACKNPFKYINYGVARIPGIYSAAAIYKDCVQHGVTGLLVENTYEAWLDAMEQYATDLALRQRVRDAAFAHVMQDYHVSAGAQILSQLMIDLLVGQCSSCIAVPVS
jgi:glycosyltransferase involved in cell wall biosynthesis